MTEAIEGLGNACARRLGAWPVRDDDLRASGQRDDDLRASGQRDDALRAMASGQRDDALRAMASEQRDDALRALSVEGGACLELLRKPSSTRGMTAPRSGVGCEIYSALAVIYYSVLS